MPIKLSITATDGEAVKVSLGDTVVQIVRATDPGDFILREGTALTFEQVYADENGEFPDDPNNV